MAFQRRKHVWVYKFFMQRSVGASISFTSDYAWARRLNWNWVTIGTLLLVVVASTWRFYRGKPVPPFVSDYFVGLFSMAVLVLISTNAQHPAHLALSWRPVVFVGTFAYSIYLVHAPLLEMVWRVIPFASFTPWLTFAALVAAGGPIIILGSYLFFWFANDRFYGKRSECNSHKRHEKMTGIPF